MHLCLAFRYISLGTELWQVWFIHSKMGNTSRTIYFFVARDQPRQQRTVNCLLNSGARLDLLSSLETFSISPQAAQTPPTRWTSLSKWFEIGPSFKATTFLRLEISQSQIVWTRLTTAHVITQLLFKQANDIQSYIPRVLHPDLCHISLFSCHNTLAGFAGGSHRSGHATGTPAESRLPKYQATVVWSWRSPTW